MIRVWTQFVGTLFILFISVGAVTGAFFNDSEGTRANAFSAFSLDANVLGTGITGSVCSLGGTKETSFILQNLGGLPFEYNSAAVHIQSENGFCALATLTATLNNVEVYSGSINGFGIGSFPLEAGGQDAWRIAVSFPEDLDSEIDTGTCTFDTKFFANQQSFATNEAFFDVETVTHSISGNTTLCKPTVDLYLNKHISGEDLGFELSDFSYRVTGNGVDTVVPHDHTVALGIGTYAIEEIVPDGFNKDDWRIGWYGQCDSGNTFSTSITVSNQNIDYGTLYCEADNQYRPDRRDRGDSDRDVEEDGKDEKDDSENNHNEEHEDGRRSSRDSRNIQYQGTVLVISSPIEETIEDGTSTSTSTLTTTLTTAIETTSIVTDETSGIEDGEENLDSDELQKKITDDVVIEEGTEADAVVTEDLEDESTIEDGEITEETEVLDAEPLKEETVLESAQDEILIEVLEE